MRSFRSCRAGEALPQQADGIPDGHPRRIGGCNGNLKGICQLVTGMKAEDVIARLDGTLCGFRNTSCPDQIAQNLKKALEEMN